jgi:formylglycine-generating enzyme required for sulfatase activity
MPHLRLSALKALTLALSVLLVTGCASIQPKVKADYSVDLAGMEFVFVKGGTYQMGSDQKPDEQPVHTVTIDDLFVGMYEVTFAQYDQYCKTIPQQCEPPSDQRWGRDNRPVIYVSWDEANAYAEWLSEQTGQKFRLPTEAEWEYFARAGTDTPYWRGETLPKGTANCLDCGSQWDNTSTAPVGSFRPNPWKIYDTVGNVVEWVTDSYTNNYGNAPTDGSAAVSAADLRKVQRGGAWNYAAKHSRSASRDYRKANKRTKDAGFRLVMEPSAQTPIPPAK